MPTIEEIIETLRALVDELEGEFDDDSPEGRLVADVAHAIAEWDQGAPRIGVKSRQGGGAR